MSSRKFVAFRFRLIKLARMRVQNKTFAIEKDVSIWTVDVHICYKGKKYSSFTGREIDLSNVLLRDGNKINWWAIRLMYKAVNNNIVGSGS